MSEQPPVQPPNQPPNQPAGQPTTPMPAASAGPPTASAAGTPTGPPGSGPPAGSAGPPAGPASGNAPNASMWQRATATNGRRWGLAAAAAAIVGLMIIGVAIAGLLVLRHVDRVELMGNRQGGRFLQEDGPGKGRGPLADDRKELRKELRKERQDDREQVPGMPGMPGGRGQGLGGLGNLLDGTALHGEVTTTVNGAVQALLFQRGEVTAVSATSITLKSSDGFAGTYGRTATTVARGVAPVQGGQAFVLARKSDKVATVIVALPGISPG